MTDRPTKVPNVPPIKQERYTAAQMVDAIRECRGMVSVTARMLKCDPVTVRNYAAKYASVAEALREARNLTTDRAELALFKKIDEGEAWAVCFYLKTQGRGRGYVERQELHMTMSRDDLAKLSDDELDALLS